MEQNTPEPARRTGLWQMTQWIKQASPPAAGASPRTLGRGAALLAGGAVIAVLIVSASHYQIDAGERGILLAQGRVEAVVEPGSGWLVPFVQRVDRVSVRAQSVKMEDLRTYTSDQQPAMIEMTIVYHVPPEAAADLYQAFGTLEEARNRGLEHQAARAMKETLSRYSAIAAIKERSRLGEEVEAAVRAAVMAPIVVDSVQLERIHFSEAYEASIQQRTVAEIAVLKAKEEEALARVEAETARISAESKAAADMIAARAEAGATRLRGEAEAASLRARADALKDAPGLVSLIQAERWNGSLPQTMLPDAGVPMLTLR